MDFDTIQIADQGEGVHLLTLFQPEKRNAISIRMREEISACLGSLAQSDQVKVLVFTGSGPAFSSGFDLREFGQEDKREALVRSSMVYHRDVWNFPRPTIAAVNGFALGGGPSKFIGMIKVLWHHAVILLAIPKFCLLVYSG